MSKQSLLITHPELIASEWDYARNERAGIYPDRITHGSDKKAYWLCLQYKHSYMMSASNKTRGRGCPYCAGRKVLQGFNDLASQHPDLLSEWDYAHNNANSIFPDMITSHANIITAWSCTHYKHSYMMRISDRINGRGCPYCAGRKVLAGFNDLMSKYPELVESEWDWVKNNEKGLKPDSIMPSSRLKTWWRCEHYAHNYEMAVYNKTGPNKQGCPYCTGHKVLRGFNDLNSKYPELVKSSWDWNRNSKNDLKPDEITYGSHKLAAWKCSVYKHDYTMTINHRITGTGCPYCAGNKVLPGFNDLASQYPELVNSEWNYARNNAIKLYPNEITSSSNRKAWWICSECGHEWFTSVAHRTSVMNPTGCPKCAEHYHISKQENQVADYINTYLCSHYPCSYYTMFRSIKFKKIYELLHINTNNALSDDLKSHLLKEIDIYIPELNLAIEYDGDYWHDNSVMLTQRGLTNDDAHQIKNELCEHAGIELLFISEHDWLHDTENVKQIIADIIDTAYARYCIF